MKLNRKSTLMLGAATALVLSSLGASAEALRFWTTEEQPERLARQEQMAADFAAASGHTVQVIPGDRKRSGHARHGCFRSRRSA